MRGVQEETGEAEGRWRGEEQERGTHSCCSNDSVCLKHDGCLKNGVLSVKGGCFKKVEGFGKEFLF